MIDKNNQYAGPITAFGNLHIEAQRLRAEAMADTAYGISHGIRSLFRALVRVGKRAAASLERMRTVDRIFGELSAMTDYDLADIGLNRSDIVAVAQGTYRREIRSEGEVVRIRPAAKVEAAEAELPRAA